MTTAILVICFVAVLVSTGLAVRTPPRPNVTPEVHIQAQARPTCDWADVESTIEEAHNDIDLFTVRRAMARWGE